jgi:aspartyl-tRNA(Asn)/glutamyl-tRNA(Gln) amidotransferase subunit A
VANDRAFESYFIQAQRVRRLIQYSFDDVFMTENALHPPGKERMPQEKCDVILCPTTVGPAPELSAIAGLLPVEMYVNDVFTVPGSLAGLPAISIPVSVDGEMVGLQLMGQVGTDALVLRTANHLSEILASSQSYTGTKYPQ